MGASEVGEVRVDVGMISETPGAKSSAWGQADFGYLPWERSEHGHLSAQYARHRLNGLQGTSV